MVTYFTNLYCYDASVDILHTLDQSVVIVQFIYKVNIRAHFKILV